MKIILLIIAVLNISENFNSPEALFKASKENNKPVLIFFSGSDWCHNCMKMDEKVVKTSLFSEKIESRTVFYQADFPQKNKQEKTTIKMNEELADAYNSSGIFPLLVLIDGDKSVLQKTTFVSSDPSFYVDLFSKDIDANN